MDHVKKKKNRPQLLEPKNISQWPFIIVNYYKKPKEHHALQCRRMMFFCHLQPVNKHFFSSFNISNAILHNENISFFILHARKMAELSDAWYLTFNWRVIFCPHFWKRIFFRVSSSNVHRLTSFDGRNILNLDLEIRHLDYLNELFFMRVFKFGSQ